MCAFGLPRRRTRRDGASVVAAMVLPATGDKYMAKASSRKSASRTPKSPKRAAAQSAGSKSAQRGAEIKAKQAPHNKRIVPAAKANASAGRPESKQAQVLAMLRGRGGATIEAITSATGWQSHSVRGFFAGVVRKKLGLVLTSEVGEGGRTYKVIDDQPATPSPSSKTSIAA